MFTLTKIERTRGGLHKTFRKKNQQKRLVDLGLSIDPLPPPPMGGGGDLYVHFSETLFILTFNGICYPPVTRLFQDIQAIQYCNPSEDNYSGGRLIYVSYLYIFLYIHIKFGTKIKNIKQAIHICKIYHCAMNACPIL